MSELLNKNMSQTRFRWQLLSTVSALTLCGTIFASAAQADDADRPTVWIELGGQLERVQSGQQPFEPSFLDIQPRPGFEKQTSSSIQRPPRYAFGGEAKAIFTPKSSDWSFLADIRFGRSNGYKHVHQQTTQRIKPGGLDFDGNPRYASLTRFGDTVAANSESHAIVDFMAGKDVGLGFGHNSTTTFDFGVRFAQFTSKTTNTLREAPDPFVERFQNGTFIGRPKYTTNTHHHIFYGQDSIWRSFSGIGPSLSLTGSQPFMGSQEDVEVAFDWGANGAVLFGRQKVHGNYKTKGSYFTNFAYVPKATYSRSAPIGRTRTVAVPNVGGFAGLTFRHADAKVSFAYRADFFFGAADGGVTARHTSDIGFFGPFATISIGLGG